MESNHIFGTFHTRIQSKDFVVVLDKILIHVDEHEDEYEKYRIRSPAYVLI